MIDYEYENIMLPKTTYRGLKALQNEVGLSSDAIVALALNGLLKQLEDKDTKEKKAALGVK